MNDSSASREAFAQNLLDNIAKRRADLGQPPIARAPAVMASPKKSTSDVERRMRAALAKLRNIDQK